MTAQRVRKAVIPVAGYGTRFLPYTKSIPKEMLPIIDRPVIHHIVEEVAEAGISEIILITGTNKRAIEDYFDYNLELEMLLEKSGKMQQKDLSREASDLASFVYVRQKEQLGNGHAVLQAKELIGEDEPFLVLWGDEMFMGKPSKVSQVVSTYEEYGQPTIMTLECTSPEDYARYGYIVPGTEHGNGVREVTGFVEKPGADAAPSPHASLGCMVLTGDIFKYLETQNPGNGGEIVLGEALNRYVQDSHPLLAKAVTGLKYFDCGNKLEYMKATVEFALARDDIGTQFREYLQDRAKSF
jgi:UTP--glucose-1-phosphate uridylyltransferase